jgi:hypothetical protein
MIQELHRCHVFVTGTHISSLDIPRSILDSDRFQVQGCSAVFVIQGTREVEDGRAIALDCTVIPQS